MKYLKKVSASQLISNTGTIIDSMNPGGDQTVNAPSIHAVKDYVDASAKGYVLWTNPNPNSNFTAQNIILSSDNYDELLFIFKSKQGENQLNYSRCLKGYYPMLFQAYCGASGIVGRDRNCNYVDDTSYSVGEGRYCATGSTGRTTDNSVIIPIYVIGYKY